MVAKFRLFQSPLTFELSGGPSGPSAAVMEWTPRELQKLGHRVVLLPPHLVRPYRRRHQKTDRADAKALLEAFRNEEIRPPLRFHTSRTSGEAPITSVGTNC